VRSYLWILALSPLVLANDSAGLPDLNSGSVRVRVENVRNHRGVLRCALFDTEKAFPGDFKKAVAGITLPAAENTCEFANVAPGNYAVAVFHDENANGKFDLKFYGMPREGYGASNNPKPRVGPPRYADARFEHSSRTTQLQIVLYYW